MNKIVFNTSVIPQAKEVLFSYLTQLYADGGEQQNDSYIFYFSKEEYEKLDEKYKNKYDETCNVLYVESTEGYVIQSFE